MFDDRLFKTIMQEMMASFGPDVRTDEGSLAYNACCKIAQKLEDVYGDMDALNDNMLPDTQDLDHLIRYAAERGISYNYATAPIVRGVFEQAVSLGAVFSCGNYSYTVTEMIDTYDYNLTCTTTGAEANTNLGKLEPITFINGWIGGEITEVIVPGEDDEETETFRTRVIDSFKVSPFGGNKSDYRNYVDAITGVGGCKPKRRDSDSAIVNIWVLSSAYGVPDADLIAEIQEAVDPTETTGEGDGMAPICHSVVVKAVEAVDISIETTITFEDGYSTDTSQSQVEKVVNAYFTELKAAWESRDASNTYVRISQIESRILDVEGVVDVANTTINGEASNLVLSFEQIPVLKEVIIDV